MADQPIYIPASNSTVKVYIIDTGARISGSDPSIFFTPIVPGFARGVGGAPSYCFLVEHNAPGEPTLRYLFDLSLPKDLTAITATTKDLSRRMQWDVQVPKDVREVLEENGIAASSINGLIWSHWHWDHAGDPTTFPESTELVVGPEFDRMLPGYPLDPGSGIRENAWAGRRRREIKFSSGASIAGMRSHDFFGDGSFFLLDTYGHTIGHMCGLARTTPDTFILMGGDACHHPGLLRPSASSPLPDNIDPSPLTHPTTPCPGSLFEGLHPTFCSDKPFMTYPLHPDGGINHSRKAALDSRDKLVRLDGLDKVFTVIAHDTTIADVLQYFPKDANNWHADSWGKKARWAFLKDFRKAIEEPEKEPAAL